MLRVATAVIALTLTGCVSVPAGTRSGVDTFEGDCSPSASDRVWLDQSMEAWKYTADNITRVGQLKNIRAVFFDAQCLVVSSTAMRGGPRRWTTTRLSGEVQVPDGPKIPVGVISFAMGGGDNGQFVMSMPSVWRAARKSDNGLGSLEKLMTAVVIHEANHVSQIPTYIQRIERLTKANNLPEDFNDDSIQERFEKNAEYVTSYQRETELLFAAADAPDDAEAKRLAREARALMRVRQQRWFTGVDTYLTEAEDIWLTMEGSAQWSAYKWVIDPQGGAVPAERTQFRTGRWWSQVQGFALFMVLDRLTGDRWRHHAFGDGAKTGLQMLDEAIVG